MPEQLWFTEILRITSFARRITGLFHKSGISPQVFRGADPKLGCNGDLGLPVPYCFIRSGPCSAVGGQARCIADTCSRVWLVSLSNRATKSSDHVEAHTPFLVSLGLFILVCNLIGLIRDSNHPPRYQLCLWGAQSSLLFTTRAQGFKHAGIKYLAHFAGPMPMLAPLMIPIELISHLARVLSLTIRLFANMLRRDMVTLVFFSLVPVGSRSCFSGCTWAYRFCKLTFLSC